MSGVGRKVEHVLGARQTRVHECHWPGCARQVKPALWGCKEHWFRLPQYLRNKIWAAYRPGQEEDGRPSLDYIAASREVREWIAANGDGRLPL